MTQQRFQVTANGFVELNGSITVEVDRNTTIAVAPYVVQNYHPYSGNGKVEGATYTELECRLKRLAYYTITCYRTSSIFYNKSS